MNERIERLRNKISELKPSYDEFNKKWRLNKEEKREKAEIGRKLYALNIQLIHELIEEDQRK